MLGLLAVKIWETVETDIFEDDLDRGDSRTCQHHYENKNMSPNPNSTSQMCPGSEVRSLRFFQGLRVLVKACQCFLPSLCWAMVLWPGSGIVLKGVIENRGLSIPRAPGYLNSRLLGYVNIGYIESRTHYLDNREP